MSRWLLALALTITLGATGAGCAGVRAQVGYGIGLGVDVQIPGVIHTGLGLGAFRNFGPLYGRANRSRRENFITTIFWHWETEEEVGADGWFAQRPERERHACWAILPPLTTYEGDDLGEKVMPWALEIGIMLLGVDLRLGFSPAGAFRKK